ncbi:MAG: hypothetical protein IJB25_14155 [Clostridia bacterium]|nr:hypothetical protein [Clostridia bacterium]
MSSEKNREKGGASIWIARLISFVLIALILVFFGRTWFSGVLGCARMFEEASYEDQDELAREPASTPIPPFEQFSDSAYDQVYPDLIEPTLEPD